MAELSLKAVSKTFDNGAVALAPIDLTVKDGEFVVLVGPSGCGKSTLLRIIAGLEKASAGSLSIDGAAVDNLPPKDRDVAMVFQSYALYPHLTVRENLEFALKMRGMPRESRKREITAAAELLQLADLLNRKPSQLSGGQQQRVALGRAIVRRPKLFLLDEPFSNLDATLRASTRTELLRLHRRLKTTTVFVTHDQVEAMTMADLLVVLKDGQVQQIGTPLDIYNHPANRFVAQFIGSPPMNLIEVGEDSDDPSLRKLCRAGGALTLGLRAEHIELLEGKSVPGNATVVTAKLILLEPLGHETLATCLVNGQDVIIRLPATSQARPGQEARLALQLEHAVWFDAVSGRALEQPDAVLQNWQDKLHH